MNSTTVAPPAPKPSPKEPTPQNWMRLENIAGVVLTTGSFILVAAATFGLQSHGLTRISLFLGGAFSFVAVLVSVLSLGIDEPSASPWPERKHKKLPGVPKRLHERLEKRDEYKLKYRYTKIGLICLLIAVEGGTLLTIAVKLS
jgi:hypothetical protein